ncbi:MAG: M12 family metallo-peptidase, partial [Flavobacteriaceae bacterium]|nr:M12 family metallo-peptidase [Flavobacteriaceae bacterium]
MLKINAQELIKTSVRKDEITAVFSQKKEIQWAIPISQNQRISLIWKERETSFSSQGIRSFVGYNGDKLRATLSISSKSISGSIFTEEGELQITDKENFIYLIKETETFECHTDEEHHHLPNRERSFSLSTLSESNASIPEIRNSNILRVYRLAVLIDYSVYSGVHFRDKQKAFTFLSDVETYLNEIYVRDLGIKFEVLKDDKLIRDTADKEVFEPRNPHIEGDTDPNKYYDNIRFITLGTEKFNDILGDENYDLGISLTRSRNGGGVAFLGDGYKKNGKAAATTNTPTKGTIAHEIGHLFGARHTFSNSETRKVGDFTDQIEIGRGYSVMSYGSPRDFFALYSIQVIRRKLVDIAYYEDETRSFIKGYYEPGVTNVPLGVPIDNQAPVIDKTKIKAEYTIPRNTYFQFYIPANDADGDKLQYLAHQTDIRPYPEKTSITKFITRKGEEQNYVIFQPRFVESGGMLFNTDVVDIGNFTFWLGARDSRPIPQQYITKYDLAETKVSIVEGTPFKLTNKFEKQYNGNDKITLTWSVDNKIFPANSKVRILFSDDFGQSFKHILANETENDGTHEISLPNIEVGTIKVGSLTPQAGVIKVEVIDNIAYAVSEVFPAKGGFTIKRDNTIPAPKIAFTNLPTDQNVS